jgi:hypothetical protein
MKQVILTIALILGVGVSHGQIVRDASGNFVHQERTTAVHDSTTTWTYTTAQGKQLPVYQGAKGGLYVLCVSSKTGRIYRKYLPKN